MAKFGCYYSNVMAPSHTNMHHVRSWLTLSYVCFNFKDVNSVGYFEDKAVGIFKITLTFSRKVESNNNCVNT